MFGLILDVIETVFDSYLLCILTKRFKFILSVPTIKGLCPLIVASRRAM